MKFLHSDYSMKILKYKKNFFFQIYTAIILNNKATNTMIDDISLFLKKTKNIYGIFILAGPPCNNYSSFHLLNVEKIDGKEFDKRQKASDNLVIKTIEIYKQIKMIFQEKMEVDLIIENPWSSKEINIGYKDDPFNFKANEFSLKLALRERPFFQPFLQENDGFLYTSKHFWCSYDFENFSKKPTAIFSTLKNIESNKCTHKKHKHSIVNLKNAEIRGRWPDKFVQYCIECFLKK